MHLQIIHEKEEEHIASDIFLPKEQEIRHVLDVHNYILRPTSYSGSHMLLDYRHYLYFHNHNIHLHLCHLLPECVPALLAEWIQHFAKHRGLECED